MNNKKQLHILFLLYLDMGTAQLLGLVGSLSGLTRLLCSTPATATIGPDQEYLAAPARLRERPSALVVPRAAPTSHAGHRPPKSADAPHGQGRRPPAEQGMAY